MPRSVVHQLEERDDASLVRLALAHDRAAFEALYERHRDRFVRLIQARGLPRGEAVLLFGKKLLDCTRSFDPGRNAQFTTLLWTAVERELISEARSAARRRRENAWIESAETNSAVDRLSRAALPLEDGVVGGAEVVLRALDELSPSDRHLLIRRYVDGAAPAELASELSLRLKDVDNRLQAAKQRLARRLPRDLVAGRSQRPRRSAADAPLRYNDPYGGSPR
jgi:RNA polymerase sigma factor (sigma-70 family)